MSFRRLLTPLVLALPLLVVAFAVLMAGQALARAISDLVAARVLLWIALSCLMLLVGDLLLLVSLLGLQAITRRDEPANDWPASDRPVSDRPVNDREEPV